MEWRKEDTRYFIAVAAAVAVIVYLVAANFGLVPSPLSSAERAQSRGAVIDELAAPRVEDAPVDVPLVEPVATAAPVAPVSSAPPTVAATVEEPPVPTAPPALVPPLEQVTEPLTDLLDVLAPIGSVVIVASAPIVTLVSPLAGLVGGLL